MQTLKKRLADAPRQALLSSNHLHSDCAADTQSLAQTPSSNTGLDSQPKFTAAIDWLDITFRSVPTLKEVREILGEAETLFQDTIDFSATRPTFNGKNWDGSGLGSKNIRVFYDNGVRPEETPDVDPALKITASGSAVGPADQIAIAYWLHGRAQGNQVDCTRIDIALDDHEKCVKLGKITEAHEAGNFFNASESSYIESKKRGQDKGVTLYFGSAKSDKRLCIYDKTIESKGKILGNRWEARFQRKAAREVLYMWIQEAIERTDELGKWYSDIVTGVIDFRDRTGADPNRGRCKLLGWFRKFLRSLCASPCRVRVPIEVPSLQKSIDWVGRSVAPTLALIKRVLKSDFTGYIETAIREGGERIPNSKRRMADSSNIHVLAY